MGKTKNPELEPEQIVEDEPILVKGPLRDDPEPEYVPAWEVVNDRQNILTDKLPPKIYSPEAMIAAGIVTEEMLEEAGYVKFTDYASTSKTGVVMVTPSSYGVTVSSAGSIMGFPRSLEQYNTVSNNFVICKGTLENIKEDIAARSLVGIAEAQIAAPVAGTYTVKLTYDGAAWGVTIIQDT